MNVSVESITYDDLPDVARLYQELTGKSTDLELMQRNFAWMQSNPDYVVLGAKVNRRTADVGLVGTLLGIVCRDILGECRPFMVIENVIVDSHQRRHGIGRSLMQRIEEIAAERGCLYIMFVSASNRAEAHQFYESIGYQSGFVQGFKKYL